MNTYCDLYFMCAAPAPWVPNSLADMMMHTKENPAGEHFDSKLAEHNNGSEVLFSSGPALEVTAATQELQRLRTQNKLLSQSIADREVLDLPCVHHLSYSLLARRRTAGRWC